MNLTTWPFEVGFYVKAGRVNEEKTIGDGNGGSPLSKIDQNLKIVCLFPYPKVEFAYFVMLTYEHIPTYKGGPCWGPHTKVAFDQNGCQ